MCLWKNSRLPSCPFLSEMRNLTIGGQGRKWRMCWFIDYTHMDTQLQRYDNLSYNGMIISLHRSPCDGEISFLLSLTSQQGLFALSWTTFYGSKWVAIKYKSSSEAERNEKTASGYKIGERTRWLRRKQIKTYRLLNQEGSGREKENSRALSIEGWLTFTPHFTHWNTAASHFCGGKCVMPSHNMCMGPILSVFKFLTKAHLFFGLIILLPY